MMWAMAEAEGGPGTEGIAGLDTSVAHPARVYERAHCPGTGDTHRGVERVERRSLPGRVGPVERPGPCQPNLIAPVPALVP